LGVPCVARRGSYLVQLAYLLGHPVAAIDPDDAITAIDKMQAILQHRGDVRASIPVEELRRESVQALLSALGL
jgi:hypothetical protein